MKKETWEKIVGGIAVTILQDTRGGLILQAKGPMSAGYSAQTAVSRTVSADKLKSLQMPEIYVETILERMVQQVLAADDGESEGEGDVPVQTGD